mgnify:CR=1 FL=1
MTFQKTVLTISVVLLLVMLVFIGFMMRQSRKNAVWPPMIAECPDYFEVVAPQVCQNTKNLGTCTAHDGIFDFTDAKYQGTHGLKAKKEWAKKCNVVWDGITNNDHA